MPNPPVEIIEIVERGPQGPKGLDGAGYSLTAQKVLDVGGLIADVSTLDDLVDGTSSVAFTPAEKVKLSELDTEAAVSSVNGQTGAVVLDISTDEFIPVTVGADETTPLAVAAAVKTFRVPYGFLLQKVKLSVTTAPTGAALIVDVKHNGTTIFYTKPQIDDGKKTSVASAVLPVFYNSHLLDDAEVTIDVTQVGSSVAGAGLKLSLIGKQRYANQAALDALTPNFTDTFEQAVAKLNRVLKFEFGTSKVSDGASIPITNWTQLRAYWNAHGNAAGPDGTTVINRENQRYPTFPTDPDTTNQNFVMAADALELTATYNEGTGEGVLRMNPTAAVSYSRTIPLADTSAIKVGQIVGLPGAEGARQQQRIRTHLINGTITPGDVFTNGFEQYGGPVGLFTITVTAVSGSTPGSLAQAMVDAVNAHPTCIAGGISAYTMPGCSGAYAITYPKRPDDDMTAPKYGYAARGSLLWWIWRDTLVTGAVTTPDTTIGNPIPGGANVGAATWSKAVKYGGNAARTVTITCTTAGGSGTAKVSIAATGTNAAFTTLTNQTVTNGANLTLPDSGRIAPTLTTNLAVGDTWTIELIPPVTHEGGRQEVFANYVVEKGAGYIKTAWPLTLTTASVVTLSPGRFLTISDYCYNKPVMLIPPGDEDGITVGQASTFSYQDNNLSQILSVGSGTFTIDRNVYAFKALLVFISPVNIAKLSVATTNSDILTFTAVPPGVKVGMYAAAYYASPFSTGIVKVIAVTATTVQLNTVVSSGIYSLWQFSPEIISAQAWSRFSMAQPLDNRWVTAVEMVADIPHTADISAWPAWWTFSNSLDPNPTPGKTGSSEIDFIDHFIYFNNSGTGNYTPAGSPLHSGTIVSATSTTAVLPSGASDVDDAYNGIKLKITSGTGNGQSILITDYDGATHTATLATAWTTIPTSTSGYGMESVVTYVNPASGASGGGALGNNLGNTPNRKVQTIMTLNRVYNYLDGELMSVKSMHWNENLRCQYGVNLAVGSTNPDFNGNGFWPVDIARFPMKYRIKELSFWAAPNAAAPEIVPAAFTP